MIRHLAVFLFGLGLVVLVGCGDIKDDPKSVPADVSGTQKAPPMVKPEGDKAGPPDN